MNSTGSLSASNTVSELPPPIRPPRVSNYHLGPADMELMRRLRQENPGQWTKKRLAQRFSCSPVFAGMVAEASQNWKDKVTAEQEAIKARWGKARRMAREDRVIRKKSWGQGEECN